MSRGIPEAERLLHRMIIEYLKLLLWLTNVLGCFQEAMMGYLILFMVSHLC